MKLLLYCTKAKPYLYKPYEYDCFPNDKASRFYLGDEPLLDIDTNLNGKIIGECDFEVEKIVEESWQSNMTQWYSKDLLKGACLDCIEMHGYLKDKGGYAIHLYNIKIYDKPKELSDYYHSESPLLPITKAPQNMMYCNGVIKTDFKLGDKVFKNVAYQIEHYVLASVQPYWLCKILNGEKTIEIRKKVLKRML